MDGFVIRKAADAAFDPAGKFRVLEWSTGQPIDPLPGTPVPVNSTWMPLLLILLNVRILERPSQPSLTARVKVT